MRADHAVESGPRRIDLDALVKATERQLGQFLVQVMRNRTLAEDVLQETLLVAIERRSELESLENPRAWLFGVARNRALHALRRGRRARAAVERLAHRRDDARDPAEAVAVRDLLVRTLSPDDRMLVVLRHVHGFTSGELAEMTGASEQAIRQRLSRARRRLVKAFESTGPVHTLFEPRR